VASVWPAPPLPEQGAGALPQPRWFPDPSPLPSPNAASALLGIKLKAEWLLMLTGG
jgi:hypothetical protein